MTHEQPAPADYRWATHTEPDFLVLQLPPVPMLTTLLTQRGFRPVAETDRLDLRAANGCALTRVDETGADLLVTIGDRVGASRIPLTGLDAGWLARAVEARHTGVLVVDSAVGPDGTTTREDLRRDVDAGGVIAALVPVQDAHPSSAVTSAEA